MRKSLLLTTLCVGLSLSPFAFAATYYIAPDKDLDGSSPNIVGNDTNPGTQSQPWKTFARALTKSNSLPYVRAGDTLILLDGIYYQRINPQYTEGTAQAPITIRTMRPEEGHDGDGNAILDSQGIRPSPISLTAAEGNDYFIIEGLVARNGGRNGEDPSSVDYRTSSVIVIKGGHNIFRRVSAYNAHPDVNAFIISIGVNAQFNLIEDCVAAGTGRIVINSYNNSNNTIRRCFTDWHSVDMRDDRNQYPWGDSIKLYSSNNSIVENSIGYGSTPMPSIQIIANCGQCKASNNKILGTVSVWSGMNKDMTPRVWGCGFKPEPCNCLRYDGDNPNDPNGDPAKDPQEYNWCLQNNKVTIDPTTGLVTFIHADRPQHTPEDDLVAKLVTDFDIGGNRAGFSLLTNGETTNNLLKDFFISNNAGYGFRSGGDDTPIPGEFITIDHATIVNNGLDKGDGYGKNIEIESTPQHIITNSYIPGIPAPYQGNGEGARIQNRYVDGVLTSESLWPWPMEERIKEEYAREFGIQNFSVTHEICETFLLSGPRPAVQDCGIALSAGNCLGDITQDKTRDLTDAIRCIRYLVGLDTLTGAELTAADANQDGSVDLSDVIRIIRDLLGLEPLPVCQ